MNTPTRLIGFSLTLIAVLGVGYGAGAAVGPLDGGTSTATSTRTATKDEDMDTHSTTQTGPSPNGSGGHADAQSHATAEQAGPARDGAAPGGSATSPLGGLVANDAGYALVAPSTTVAPGPGQPFTFSINGPDGAPVTTFTEEHTKELHLIGIRRDGGDYQHVHPTRDASGRWLATLDLSPGPWRFIADTVPAGAPAKITLGMDVRVPGDYRPAAATAPSSTATVADYTVTLAGVPTAGTPTELMFSVTRAGAPVTTEPYLGARGHLVAVREGDLGYLHVHPDTDDLLFTATFPTAGRYRLFLDISVNGQVRTAPFTVEVTP